MRCGLYATLKKPQGKNYSLVKRHQQALQALNLGKCDQSEDCECLIKIQEKESASRLEYRKNYTIKFLNEEKCFRIRML